MNSGSDQHGGAATSASTEAGDPGHSHRRAHFVWSAGPPLVRNAAFRRSGKRSPRDRQAAHDHSGARARRVPAVTRTGHFVNLFEIANLHELATDYRLLEVRGVPPGEHYDKMLNQLVKQVAYAVQQPVALVRRQEHHALAPPAAAPLPALEQHLSPPYVVTLEPDQAAQPLDFARLAAANTPIARVFLQFALRSPLMRDPRLWGSGALWYHKQPLPADGARVDLYPGFAWNLVATGNGRLFVALDTTVRYVDRQWLNQRLIGGDLDGYRFRRCLYHFGHQWYLVQLLALTGLSVAEQRFVPEGGREATDVLTYTRQRWQQHPAPWVRDLAPESPAIMYRYPGNAKQRLGALALCKLALSTAERETAGLHRRSISEPVQRFAQIAQEVEDHFRGARLNGVPIHVATSPLQTERCVFPVPPQLFGHKRVLSVADGAPGGAPSSAAGGNETVALAQLGMHRQRLLLDPQVGPLDTTPFDIQYVLQPLSLPRAINEDFFQRFQEAMREVSGRQDYAAKRIVYDDGRATSLFRQVEALRQAIAEHGIDRGYALLVLPERSNRDLHNYLKRSLWPDVQIQCATAGKIHAHYQATADGGYRPAPGQAGKLTSYVRNCAYAMIVVNRKWPWALAAPLHYDVYVGIDVLHGMAGLVFVYDRGRHIYFRHHPSKQRERLTSPQLRHILVTHLREDLQALGLHPRSLVVHRDGRAYVTEVAGVHQAVRELQVDGLLPPDVQVGVVDIRKTSADHLRLVEGPDLTSVENPTVGSAFMLNAREGIVCTTGWPFSFPGTPKPLAAVVSDGDLHIGWVLEDLFGLSQLVYTAPDKCMRPPATIKLADDLLEPIAGEADDEAAMYDADTETYDEDKEDEAVGVGRSTG